MTQYGDLRVPPSRTPLRIGILGAGQMARQHARAILRLGGKATLTAVADPSSEAASQMERIQPGIAVFTAAPELFAAQCVDVVHICAPPDTHEHLAEEAIATGHHVYVEKPFVETLSAARRICTEADRRQLKVCPGHQLLYEPPTRRAIDLLPALGDLAHVESYFSFRPAKHNQNGRVPPRDDLQLIDIMPHPLYLLLDILERASDGSTRLCSVEAGPKGTVHAFIRRGELTGSLTVTLEGRPVESYTRLVGANGSLQADYVRGTVQRNIGPGVSGIDKILSPYRLSKQLLTGTTAALTQRLLNRQTSYPGLVAILESFYDAIAGAAKSPVSRTNLLDTVYICEQVTQALSRARPRRILSGFGTTEPPIVVTGGTGLLGKEIVRALAERGEHVRVVARRTPPDWERIAGASYVSCDLSRSIGPDVLHSAKAIIHCAAETAGRWDEHRKNSVIAAENLVSAAIEAGVKRIVHVSSISVLSVPRRGDALSESTHFEPDSRTGGPNAWGKIESERLIVSRSAGAGIEVRVLRPAAIIDHRRFDPPGLLGRRIGNFFVAVGAPWHRLGVVDVTFCAHTAAWAVRHFASCPEVLNVFDPDLPAKRALVSELRASNPDLTVIWMPRVVLVPLSAFAFALQKLLRPRKPALSLAKVFARLDYDTTCISRFAPAIKADSQTPSVGEAADTSAFTESEREEGQRQAVRQFASGV